MKIQVSQDTLHQYLDEHNITFSMLAERMGVSVGIVSGCFNHKPNRLGKPLKFSAANLERLNAALSQIADELRQATLTFGSEETFTNSWGRTYDPAVRQPVLDLARYFKLTPFLERVLGWKKGRRDMILVSRNSPVYGQVSQDDVNRINMELLSVAGVLSSYEVVETTNPDAINPDKQNDKPVKTKEVHTQVQERHPWDDTALDLRERFRLFSQEYPDGILFFRVDNTYKPDPDYTVAYDHAHFLAKSFPDIHPYTDIASGLVTAVMDEPTFTRITSLLTANGQHYDVTPMYAE